jgi:DNA-binding XRE family transcriptional regulator
MEQRDLRQVIARNVRVARAAKGISREALADEASVDRSYMSRIERGVTWVGVEILRPTAGRPQIAEPARNRMRSLSVSVQMVGGKIACRRCGSVKKAAGGLMDEFRPYKVRTSKQSRTIIEGQAKWKAPHFENGLPIRGAASISTSSNGMKVPSW